MTKEEIKRHLAKIIYEEDPEEYANIEQVLNMDWEELFDKLVHTIQDAHESYSI